nr:tyrosine-type recombinase/integrase [uncultured Cohaesibacter sp.]
MNDTVYHALLEAKSKAMTEHVITWGDKPVKSLKRSLATASAKAGLKRVTAHLLRHSAAVWMAEEGNSMSEIAQFLGHSDSRITEKVYAKYSPDYLRKTAKATELDM